MNHHHGFFVKCSLHVGEMLHGYPPPFYFIQGFFIYEVAKSHAIIYKLRPSFARSTPLHVTFHFETRDLVDLLDASPYMPELS